MLQCLQVEDNLSVLNPAEGAYKSSTGSISLLIYRRFIYMKKAAIFYNVSLGIFWEAAYVIVIILIGILFTLLMQLIR